MLWTTYCCFGCSALLLSSKTNCKLSLIWWANLGSPLSASTPLKQPIQSSIRQLVVAEPHSQTSKSRVLIANARFNFIVPILSNAVKLFCHVQTTIASQQCCCRRPRCSSDSSGLSWVVSVGADHKRRVIQSHTNLWPHYLKRFQIYKRTNMFLWLTKVATNQ